MSKIRILQFTHCNENQQISNVCAHVKEKTKKTKYPMASAIFNQKVKLSRNELLTSSFDQFLIEYAYAFKARKLLKYTISVN